MLPALGLIAALVASAAPAKTGWETQWARARQLTGALEYESALPLLKELASRPEVPPGPRVEVLLELGLAYVNVGDPNAAKAAFVKAVEFDAEAALPATSPPKARELLDAVRPKKPSPVAAEPPSFEARLKRAASAYADAEFELTLRELDAAMPLAPRDDERASVWLQRGLALAGLGDTPRAEAAFRQGLRLRPQAPLPLPTTARVRADFEALRQSLAPAPPVEVKRPPPEPAPPPSTRGSLTAPAVATGALGVVGLGVGVALQVAFATLDADLARTPRPEAQVLSALGQRDAYRAGAITGYAVGGALALTSLILFLLNEQRPAAVTLWLMPDAATLSVASSF